MFSDKKSSKSSKSSKMATNSNSQQNTIAKGTKITGDIVSEGDFRIEGNVEGNIQTPGKVVIGNTGTIKGTLKAENADIEGIFSGKLQLSGTLTLKSTAQVDGEAEVGKLAVEPGANFNATCQMKGGLKELKTGGRSQQQGKIKPQDKEQIAQ